MPIKTLPTQVQSDLHDMADALGERVARGDMVEVSYDTTPNKTQPPLGVVCTCTRYSEETAKDTYLFWADGDPKCRYMHLQPLPEPFTIKVAR